MSKHTFNSELFSFPFFTPSFYPRSGRCGFLTAPDSDIKGEKRRIIVLKLNGSVLRSLFLYFT